MPKPTFFDRHGKPTRSGWNLLNPFDNPPVSHDERMAGEYLFAARRDAKTILDYYQDESPEWARRMGRSCYSRGSKALELRSEVTR